MSIRNLCLAALPLLAVACAPVERATDDNRGGDVPAVTVLGEGQNCIMNDRIRRTVVRNDQIIDFEMQGGQVYRSTLRQSCPGLSFDRAITYEISINQLCTPQIIYSLQTIGGVPQRGAPCSLGEFVPVEYVKE